MWKETVPFLCHYIFYVCSRRTVRILGSWGAPMAKLDANQPRFKDNGLYLLSRVYNPEITVIFIPTDKNHVFGDHTNTEAKHCIGLLL